MTGDRGSRPTVSAATAEGASGEEVERVIVHRFDGTMTEIERAQIITMDLAGLAIAWKDSDEKVHRSIGLPLEVISRTSRILRPA